jgi:hypothetical protein
VSYIQDPTYEYTDRLDSTCDHDIVVATLPGDPYIEGITRGAIPCSVSKADEVRETESEQAGTAERFRRLNHPEKDVQRSPPICKYLSL